VSLDKETTLELLKLHAGENDREHDGGVDPLPRDGGGDGREEQEKQRRTPASGTVTNSVARRSSGSRQWRRTTARQEWRIAATKEHKGRRARLTEKVMVHARAARPWE
jgi:hypothetical protein